MSTKLALILTAATAFCSMVIGLGLLFAFIDPNSAKAEERAGMLGSAVGTLTLIPIFCIWIVWGLSKRKDRLAPKKKQAKR